MFIDEQTYVTLAHDLIYDFSVWGATWICTSLLRLCAIAYSGSGCKLLLSDLVLVDVASRGYNDNRWKYYCSELLIMDIDDLITL